MQQAVDVSPHSVSQYHSIIVYSITVCSNTVSQYTVSQCHSIQYHTFYFGKPASHSEGRRFHRKEEAEVVLRDWVRLHKFGFYGSGIVQVAPKWEERNKSGGVP